MNYCELPEILTLVSENTYFKQLTAYLKVIFPSRVN